MTPLPTVRILALGGTIASAPARQDGPAGPRLSAAELVAAVPQLGAVADIDVRDLTRLPSCDVTFALARRVAAEVADAAALGAVGVVVTQGTDTIEEMSFCLDLLVSGDVPVAVVGAMRHSALPGADGSANLLDGVRVACSPLARGLGVLVVLNGEIHSARTVRKAHATSPSAFSSPVVGPLGWMSEGVPQLRDRPHPRVTVALPPDVEVVRVPLVRITMDDDGWWLDALRTTPPRGLVLDGMGGGHVPSWLAESVVDLAAAVPVVLTSRTGAGDVLTRTYGGFPGSESALVGGGLLPAGSLDALKARVLLSLMLTAGADREQITEAFAQSGALRRSAGHLPT